MGLIYPRGVGKGIPLCKIEELIKQYRSEIINQEGKMGTAKIELAKALISDVLPNGYEVGELCNGSCGECGIHNSDCEYGASVKIDGTRIQFKVRKQDEE